MSDTVRRALGIVLALVLLGSGWVFSEQHAASLHRAAHTTAKAAARASLSKAVEAIDKRTRLAGDQASGFARSERFGPIAKERDDDAAFTSTLADAFTTEEWTQSWRSQGLWGFFAGDRLLYSTGALPPVPALDALRVEAEAKGQSSTLTSGLKQIFSLGLAVVEAKKQNTTVVFAQPLDAASLTALGREAGAVIGVFGTAGEVLGTADQAQTTHLSRFVDDPAHEHDACCAWQAVGGVKVGVWTDPQPVLLAADSTASRDRAAVLGLAGLLSLVALIFAFRSPGQQQLTAEHTQLLRETAAELQRSKEELLRLSQRISSPGMTAPSMATEPGLDRTAASITASRYELVAPLGEGGMARVSVAQVRGAEGFRRLFVVKRLRPEMGGNTEIISQFIDEARLGASLVHSNIVPVFDFGRDAEGYFLAQEYILGRDVDALIRESMARRSRPLEPAVVLYLAQEALKALSYAHTKHDDQGRALGLVHRDVSPNNLMITARGELKLLDFGIVKSEQRLTKTQTGVVKGNLFFMSPEQARALEVDARSDLFSLGLVLFNALTGDTLYHGNTSYELLTRAGLGPTPEDQALIAALPGGLGPLLARALHVDPAQRYRDAEEFGRAVAAAGPTASAADLQALMDWLFKDSLAAETAQLSRTNS